MTEATKRTEAPPNTALIDQGPQGPRRRAQAAGHVYRRHRRRLGPASHGLRGGRQRHRRGAGRPWRPDRRSRSIRRLGDRDRQRPRHPDRHPRRRRRVGGRSDHDPAPCRRKVRPEFLQGVRRPARRRRVGRQCAVGEAGPEDLARRQGTFHALRHGEPEAPLAVGRADAERQDAAPRHLPAPHHDLHHDRVRLRDARASPARTRVPQFRRAHPCPTSAAPSRRSRRCTTRAASGLRPLSSTAPSR